MPEWTAWTITIVAACVVVYLLCELAHGWREACSPQEVDQDQLEHKQEN